MRTIDRPPAARTTARDREPAQARARLVLALAAGKAAGTAAQVLQLGGGTSFPGSLARRIDPQILRKVAAASDARNLVVTGSNGKTTTCRMIAAIAGHGGFQVLQNRTGSNLIQGVTSAAVRGASLQGRTDAQLLLLEVDEWVVGRVMGDLNPDTFLITNVFRDQLDRFGELYSMARALESAIEKLPQSATVVLNADDPLVASLAPDAPAGRLHYGIQTTGQAGDQLRVPEHHADSIRCMRCQHELTYSAVHLSHLGDYRCPACGNARPALDVAVTAVQPSGSGSEITLDTPAGQFSMLVPLPGMHNVYNTAAAIAAALSLALPVQPGQTRRALAGLRPAFGRLEEIQAGDQQVTLAFVKNPTSYNITLQALLERPGPQHVLAAHSNTVVDGEDFAWLWDVDLERLVPRLGSLTVSGTKAEEVALRFKYAGADPALLRVLPDRTAALDTALNQMPSGQTLHILAGYTPMRELRAIMQRRGWVAPFWEE